MGTKSQSANELGRLGLPAGSGENTALEIEFMGVGGATVRDDNTGPGVGRLWTYHFILLSLRFLI